MSFSFLPRTRRSLTNTPQVNTLTVDVHAHVLPGLDDGVESVEESITILRAMSQMGYSKVIATPHIMGDFYRNTPSVIEFVRDEIQTQLNRRGVKIELEAAAEYYLDVDFVAMLDSTRRLLTFGGKYLLIETSIITTPPFLNEAIRLIKNRGFIPVLAHPERYLYLQKSFALVLELSQKGVLFQVNTASLLNTADAETRNLAEKLIEYKLASFMGSNLHRSAQVSQLKFAAALPHFKLAIADSALLNNRL